MVAFRVAFEDARKYFVVESLVQSLAQRVLVIQLLCDVSRIRPRGVLRVVVFRPGVARLVNGAAVAVTRCTQKPRRTWFVAPFSLGGRGKSPEGDIRGKTSSVC